MQSQNTSKDRSFSSCIDKDLGRMTLFEISE